MTPEQLAEWAAETEIAAGAGALRGGRLARDLADASDQGAALKIYDSCAMPAMRRRSGR